MTVDQLRAALAGVPGHFPVVLNVGRNELANGCRMSSARRSVLVTRDECEYWEPYDGEGDCTFTGEDCRLELVFSIRSPGPKDNS
jgi:hypothetical protein